MNEVYSLLRQVRKTKPLVYHITNQVTIYDCAAATRAFGALPVMAHAKEEAEDMAKISSSLVLNIGTLSAELIEAMIIAGKEANRKGIPVTLDAVGAGATPFRTKETLRILSSVKVDVLKGNPGELAAIAGISAVVKGVESISAGAPPVEICRRLVEKYGCTAIITGKQDVCVSKIAAYFIDNGHPLMGEVVGTGCMATSAIGAFCAVEKDFSKAAACALACYGIAGELAAKKAGGPGSFKPLFMDEISSLDEAKIVAGIKVRKT